MHTLTSPLVRLLSEVSDILGVLLNLELGELSVESSLMAQNGLFDGAVSCLNPTG